MSFFLVSKRKIFEIGLLFVLDLVFYFLWGSFDFVVLFSFGYVWNWVASQESEVAFGNSRRYRFSTLKTVFNLQNLFLKPFRRWPWPLQTLIKVLPAGLFWGGVIFFNESEMPFWAVFLGSLTLELVLLEQRFLKPQGPDA